MIQPKQFTFSLDIRDDNCDISQHQMSDFQSWLGQELKAINADEDVFLPYIVSILEDDDEESKEESIEGILEGIDQAAELSKKIVGKWQATSGSAGTKVVDQVAKDLKTIDLNAKLASITENQTAAYAASKACSTKQSITPDKSVKDLILAQYTGMEGSSGDDDDEDDDDPGGASGNANVEAVARAEHEKREKAKAAAQAKKDKDKEDREKQKKAAEDRKKKAQEKASKVERRK